MYIGNDTYSIYNTTNKTYNTNQTLDMTPRILLLGGHGKVSLLMTPKIVSRSWNLISMIRDPAQKDDILNAAKSGPGKVDVLVDSIEDVKSESDAKRILDSVKPDWVIWCAGMGLSPFFPSLISIQLF